MKIVGICLVRNDDRFLKTVLENVIGFCDELIIADHASTDGTAAIASEFVQQHPGKVRYARIRTPQESHELIRPYCGENVWLFGVDGDEIYEPDRLKTFRQQLLSGRFKDVWQVLGKVLHCAQYDEAARRAEGYLARPSRSMTKLYNFSLIEDWAGECTERLHGGQVRFKDERHRDRKDHSESEMPWDEAIFRCLHMVFIRRSSLQPEGDVARPNIAEKFAFSRWEKVKYRLMQCLGKEPPSKTKHLTYMRGPLETLDVHCFFNNFSES